MTKDRLFLDTAFIQALLNPRDDYHEQAKQLFSRIRTASEVWITEAIFAEVGNALSAFNRKGAVQFIQLHLLRRHATAKPDRCRNRRSPFYPSRLSCLNVDLEK